MSEELKKDEPVVEPEIEAIDPPEEGDEGTNEPTPGEKEYTAEEQRAMDGGWLPLEDWVAAGNDEAEWRSAREFNDRGELLGSIKTLNKRLEQSEKALRGFAKHHEGVFAAAHKKALEDLRAHRKLAIKEGDLELADEINDEIEREKEEFQSTQKEMKPVAQTATPQNADVAQVQAWAKRNEWYGKDEDMREAANGFILAYVQKERAKGNMPSRLEALEHAERKVKRMFKQNTPQRREPPAMGVRGKVPSKSGKVTIQLTPEEKQVMKALVDSGEMTREQYLKEVAMIRENS